MRRIALLGLVLTLPACSGFGDFLGDTMTYGTNPNRPLANSENARRVLGQDTTAEPLVPEPGNIWPEAVAAAPTLQDLEKGGNVQPQTPPPPGGPPYLPDHRQPRPRGSSTPPGSNQPELAPPLELPPRPSPPVSSAPPPPKAGQPLQTQTGTGVTSGGTSGYQTLTTPQGQAIVVPNGNGTSTVIHPNGTVEIIPTPR
jgi:hypothetical protein